MKRLLTTIAILFTTLANAAAPNESIYQLNVQLIDQAGSAHKLDLYRNQPTLVTLFYSSCPNVCPLLFETMQFMERSLDGEQRSRLRVLMISIDPDRDTPAALNTLAKTHHADLTRWTLTRANAKDVRKIAAVLNVQYRQLPNGEFNHSSVINLLDKDGRIVTSTNRLATVDEQFMATLKKTLTP